MITTVHSFAAGCLVALAALAALTVDPAPAQPLGGFTRSDDYVVEIDGAPSAKADVYWSQSARMFLVVAKELSSPLVVHPVTKQVRAVPLVKVASRPDGSVEILDGAALQTRATLDTSQTGASFSIDGRAVRLTEKPPLLGWQTTEALASYSPMYAERAAAYEPQPAVVQDLRRRSSDVRLTVFFGSWCPFCQQKVPTAMKLANELAGSQVKIDFYGLPKGFSGEPQAKKYGVKAVPTGIVFVDGKEAGRITADGWANVEAALNRILAGTSS